MTEEEIIIALGRDPEEERLTLKEGNALEEVQGLLEKAKEALNVFPDELASEIWDAAKDDLLMV